MSIQIDHHTDAFTYHVYQSIDAEVRATLTPRQVHAIETAIRANKPYQKHPFDLRGVLPLFFIRLYFVILIGRDKRSPTRNKEAKRRKQTVLGSTLLSAYILLCMLIPVVFLLLYLFKSALGINLLENSHLSDFISQATLMENSEQHL